MSKTKQHECNKAYRRESEEDSVGWWNATCERQRSSKGGVRWMDGWMDVWSLYSSAAQEKKRPAYHGDKICAMYPWTVRSTIGKKIRRKKPGNWTGSFDGF